MGLTIMAPSLFSHTVFRSVESVASASIPYAEKLGLGWDMAVGTCSPRPPFKGGGDSLLQVLVDLRGL